jgi:hypothetical protein
LKKEGKRTFQCEHRRGRALVAKHLLLRGLRKGQVAQQSGHDRVDVRVIMTRVREVCGRFDFG